MSKTEIEDLREWIKEYNVKVIRFTQYFFFKKPLDEQYDPSKMLLSICALNLMVTNKTLVSGIEADKRNKAVEFEKKIIELTCLMFTKGHKVLKIGLSLPSLSLNMKEWKDLESTLKSSSFVPKSMM